MKLKVSKDINNLDTYETKTKVNAPKWRPIYEVIDEAYVKYSNFSSDGFIKEYMDISTKHMIYHAR